jgi:hypothetical protein
MEKAERMEHIDNQTIGADKTLTVLNKNLTTTLLQPHIK